MRVNAGLLAVMLAACERAGPPSPPAVEGDFISWEVTSQLMCVQNCLNVRLSATPDGAIQASLWAAPWDWDSAPPHNGDRSTRQRQATVDAARYARLREQLEPARVHAASQPDWTKECEIFMTDEAELLVTWRRDGEERLLLFPLGCFRHPLRDALLSTPETLGISFDKLMSDGELKPDT